MPWFDVTVERMYTVDSRAGNETAHKLQVDLGPRSLLEFLQVIFFSLFFPSEFRGLLPFPFSEVGNGKKNKRHG